MLHYNGFKIRPIQLEDNTQICNVIKGVFYELNLPKIGTTYVDKDTDSMFEAYQDKKSIYYVVEKDDKILGGCGIKKLDGSDKNICELQKLYFHQSLRGKGVGKFILDLCLKFAKEVGYDFCYLESTSVLKISHYLYKIFEFENLEGPLGDTSHYSCDVHMIKKLK